MGNSLISLADDWIQNGKNVALALVVQTWGSAPRQPGSIMLIDEDSKIAGSVSAGCVEADVIENAIMGIRQGKAIYKEYGVADHQAYSVGLSCGGQIRILIMPIQPGVFPPETLKKCASAVNKRESTNLSISFNDKGSIQIDYTPADKAWECSYNNADQVFTWRIRPASRLIIVGAGHIGQILSRLALELDFDVLVVDPRSTFASRERFPHVQIIAKWPQDIMPRLGLDAQCAVVTLAHDPKIDDPALMLAINSPAFYIGSLGSKRTHELRCRRLKDAGMSSEQLIRIHGPAGLKLNGRGAAEIALSILAQIVAFKYKDTSKSVSGLRERTA